MIESPEASDSWELHENSKRSAQKALVLHKSENFTPLEKKNKPNSPTLGEGKDLKQIQQIYPELMVRN